jgi:hypothetical protein
VVLQALLESVPREPWHQKSQDSVRTKPLCACCVLVASDQWFALLRLCLIRRASNSRKSWLAFPRSYLYIMQPAGRPCTAHSSVCGGLKHWRPSPQSSTWIAKHYRKGCWRVFGTNRRCQLPWYGLGQQTCRAFVCGIPACTVTRYNISC